MHHLPPRLLFAYFLPSSDVFELCQAQSTLPSVEVVMDGPYDIPVLVPKGIPLDTTDSIGEDYGIITFVVHVRETM